MTANWIWRTMVGKMVLYDFRRACMARFSESQIVLLRLKFGSCSVKL